MIEVTLPDHDDMLDNLCCVECDTETVSLTTANVYSYKGRKVRVSNIRAHKCLECGMEIYSAGVTDMVVHAVRDAVNKEENEC